MVLENTLSLGLDTKKEGLVKQLDINGIRQFDEVFELFKENFEANKKTLTKEYSSSNVFKDFSENQRLENNFKSWYTGNFNESTGKITLYCFMDHFSHLHDIILNGSDILPPGYLSHSSEEALFDDLIKSGNSIYVDAVNDFKNKKLLKDFFKNAVDNYSLESRWSISDNNNYTLNPFIRLSSLSNEESNNFNKQYQITIEVDSNEAQRIGGHKDRHLVSDFNNGEWLVAGPILHKSILQIENLYSRDIVYRKSLS